MINEDRDAYVMRYAKEYHDELVRAALDLNRLLALILAAQDALVGEFRRIMKKRDLGPYLKKRAPGTPRGPLYWGRPCRPPPTLLASPPDSAKKLKRWTEHFSGGLTRKRIYHFAKDVASARIYGDVDRQMTHLNLAQTTVNRARQSFEHTLSGVYESNAWMADTLPVQVPLVPVGLPDTSKRALGHAWPLVLKMAAADYELLALSARHNADPPHRLLRLRFERDRGHPYGRCHWTYFGKSALGFARSFAKDNERIRDSANLTERVLRGLRIPAHDRGAVRPFEDARRLLERARAPIVGRFINLKRNAARKAAKVAELLARSEAIDPLAGL
jgi:hypothetical protein